MVRYHQHEWTKAPLPRPELRYGYARPRGPCLGTSSYRSAVILRLMSTAGTASTNRAPSSRLKQRTAARACSSSASRSVRLPARSRYTTDPWTWRTNPVLMNQAARWGTSGSPLMPRCTVCLTLPGSNCRAWCTRGDPPSTQRWAPCWAAGWQWWLR